MNILQNYINYAFNFFKFHAAYLDCFLCTCSESLWLRRCLISRWTLGCRGSNRRVPQNHHSNRRHGAERVECTRNSGTNQERNKSKRIRSNELDKKGKKTDFCSYDCMHIGWFLRQSKKYSAYLHVFLAVAACSRRCKSEHSERSNI